MIVFILVHLLLSILIAFIGLNKINKQERFCSFMVALFFPVGGYFTVLILYLFRNQDRKTIDEEPDIMDSHMLFTGRFNSGKGTDIVSLEETLLINDTKTKRQQLIEALKKDSTKYIDMLKIALRDEDVETSHYAASAVAEIKRTLDLKLQAFSVEYEKNIHSIELLKEYAVVLEEYLNSGLLDEYSHRKKIYTYIEVLEKLLLNEKNKEIYYDKLINAIFEVGEINRAEKYCKDFLESYESESSYLQNLKYYYLLRDKKNFNAVFEKLRNSTIRLSYKGIDIIRLWMDGV